MLPQARVGTDQGTVHGTTTTVCGSGLTAPFFGYFRPVCDVVGGGG